MTATLSGSDVPLAAAHDLALVDLDGVAYQGHLPIPHAADSLTAARTAGLRLVFVTNNASREPEEVAGQLTGLGIPTGADEVMTAAQACAALLRTRLDPGAGVLVVGGPGLRTAVADAGLTVVDSADDAPEAVAQGYAAGLGWSDLAEAAYAVAGGAWHVASNLDLSLPTARGFAPGNGALVGAVVAATGVEPDSAGKPSPTMYRLAVDRAGAERPLVIGDRLDTDLAGARAGGYPGLHVLTGVSSARDAVLAAPGLRPDYLGGDLRALLEPHPRPESGPEGWWTCEGRAARVVDGALELDGQGPRGIDVARAACAAAWDAADGGSPVDPTTVPELQA
ncbi:HAD-IIA family hydrolase [Krasilnikoviella flava]|uniref:Haloacid Dehalogenase Superfamily Class (Subfamily) IIA/haloacid dehalogenase superfamily, subfamily IA, variant 1 with third motif having Dx(3-4)D or Dx(3-4)E n=1 Tax=Krasilnikoviella flava TaxID=526729 RepID=A0A1T5M3L2_9MICO|nr:HAD hydrolase-like protein [Krasilnikoviella flava]SKC82408.1 Haloacid Dehalogenase Superfamily Class (subfamily) IIA/haloacid dehalogenase superfamily, subfamily IA, variant 1 with third motif having Dx(3-4)D or Dx(3-4)E [Krasilnikoviella flava]